MKKHSITFLLFSTIIFLLSCQKPSDSEIINKDKTEINDLNDSIYSSNEQDYSNWMKYSIKGFGEMQIPAEMEIQKGKFKDLNDKLREINGLSGEQFVFQQSGLNEFDDDAKNSYARVMIKTEMGEKGELSDLNDYPFSDNELKEFEIEYKKEIQNNFVKSKIKLTEWYPIQITSLNGMRPILITYKRKIENNPEAFVSMYIFMNNDRYHMVTFSYRITDEVKWKPMFKNILETIRIDEVE